MSTLHVSARELLHWTEEQLWASKDAERVIIDFDDGPLELTETIRIKAGGKEHDLDYNPMGATRISWYYWEIHREFPDAPLLKRQHIGHRLYTANTHFDMLTDVYFSTLDTYRGKKLQMNTERWMWLLMKTVMGLYNAYVTYLPEYCTGVSIIDFHEVVNHPKVKAANDAILAKDKVTYDDIAEAHQEIMSVLSDPFAFKNNGVNNAIVRELVSSGQVLQCVGPRGFVEDIDSNIFREAIRAGYYHGLYQMRDFLMDSRSASKAAYYQQRHMGNSEYLNRSIQLSSAPLYTAHAGDCGNERVGPFTIHDKVDFKAIQGKWYRDKRTDKGWKVVRPESRDLIGKTIWVRSLFGCKHPDRYGKCAACLGDMYDSFIKGTSIGWVASADIFGRGGQLLLSVKHHDGSVSAHMFDIDPFVGSYIQPTQNPEYLKLNKQLKDKQPAILIKQKEFGCLHHVLHADDVRKLMPSNLLTMTSVEFETQDDMGTTIAPIDLENVAHKASFTYEALEYIKKVTWTVTNKNKARIDLSGWDFSQPFFLLPLKHHSMVEQMGGMKKAVLGSRDRLKGKAYRIMDFDTPEAATVFFHELLSPKMPGTNYALIELVVACTLSTAPDKGDYSIPQMLHEGQVTVHRSAMFGRALGPMMGFERHHEFFVDPASYLNQQRGWSPMDMVLKHELAEGLSPVLPPPGL